MIGPPKFIVTCRRINKTKNYEVSFPFNTQLNDRIKNIDVKNRRYNPDKGCWEINALDLLELIKIYKSSNKIHFEFGEDKEVFRSYVLKKDLERREREAKLRQIIKNNEDSLTFKIDLEKNYVLYDELVHKNLKAGIKLYPYQIAATAFTNKARNVLLALEMGLGKAQNLSAKILTPKGWTTMGEIKVGDSVIGSDGKPKKVLGIYPQGIKDIYEIKFNDDTSTKCCEEHLWAVNTTTRNFRNKKINNSYPFQVKPLSKIMEEGLTFKNGNRKHYIPIVQTIEFEEKKLLIDPYVLGCLLGDGGLTIKNSISFSSIDKEIINNINERLPKNHKLNIKKNSKIDYYLVGDNKINLINRSLKFYNLKEKNSYNKFIPEDYLFGSIEQRLELLRGLLDTDGHSRKDSIIEIILASKQLIEDIQFIVESLGGIGRLKEKIVKYNGENRLYYKLNLKLPPEFIPFKLKRKIETFVSNTKYLPNRAIKSINYVGKEEAKCILIDSYDHLYCTDHCILTHNTLSSIAYVEMNDFNKIMVITPNSLKYNYYNEVCKFTKSKAHIVNAKKNKYSIEESKYVIINYDYFNSGDEKKMRSKFKKLNLKISEIDAVIADECQKLKNGESNTYKNFKRLFKDLPSKVFLSGTPAPNRAHELYTILNQISPLEFPRKTDFMELYCGVTYDSETGRYDKASKNTQLEKLFHKLEPFTYRKRKDEVLKDLPDKIYQKIVLELSDSEQRIYNEIEEGVANEIFSGAQMSGANILTIMLRLRQYTAMLKVNAIKEVIETIINEDEKAVVVDMFKTTLYDINKKFKEVSAVHTGDQTVDERSDIINKFQDKNSDLLLFLGSIQTCNYGLTLTAANKLFVITLPFSVGEYDQVSDRIHRIGQKNTVNIYSFVFRDTIDEYVFDLIENKRAEVMKVIDNIDYESNINESILMDVVMKLKEKYNK